MRLAVVTLTLLGIACLTLTQAHTNTDSGKPSCAHNLFKEEPLLLDVEEESLPDASRLLQTVTYPNIRITTDFTRMTFATVTTETTTFKNYVQNKLVPPIVDYFEAALKVKQPLTSTLKLSSSTTSICGYATPTGLSVGTATDFYVIVGSLEDTQNWVASAGACFLSSTTKRPLIARLLFNTLYTKAADNDILAHEKNMYVTMHEFIHAFGFTGSSFVNFIDSSGKTLTGHIKTVLLNGSNRTVLDVEPLTSKLRAHFGCSTLPGAFMEDDGGDGTAGSHFERRQFLYEVMTSGVIDDHRISEFSLAALEGSGWYQPNYTYADSFYFGQGLGCNFLYQDCAASSFTYDEFCKTNGRQCTAAGRGGGICAADSRSDSCYYYLPDNDYDCENPDALANARLPTYETYGRGLGSRCFNGNLTTGTAKAAVTSLCFKYNCVGSGLTTSLEVMVGSIKVTCKQEGPAKFSGGINGNLNCPDPLTFCSTVGKKYCPRNCMGRGTCVNGACKCNTGYTGTDCALNV